MIELIQVLIAILNLISTWRALLSLAIAIATAFAVSLLIPSGRALAITICGILIVGASIGIRWHISTKGGPGAGVKADAYDWQHRVVTSQ